MKLPRLLALSFVFLLGVNLGARASDSWQEASSDSEAKTQPIMLSEQTASSKVMPSQKMERGVIAYHVDLRVQVMPIKALKDMAQEISRMGFNTLIMEWEATYPYKEHAIISNQYAYTRKEISEFIKFCTSLGLKVIPLQQTLGHAEYILKHERYAYLRADRKNFSQIDPTRLKQAEKLFSQLISDLIATHPSEYVHIGGDETELLACVRCVETFTDKNISEGKSRLYVDYMTTMANIVTEHGKTPLIWGDMISAYPEAVERMPKNVIYIDWNYGWAVDRFGTAPDVLKQKHHLKYWGATAIRSWPDDYHINTWETHLKNQVDYLNYAKSSEFEGYVLTSWSTSGQYSYEWFNGEVVTLKPIRIVYPHAYPDDPFRMTTEFFIASLTSKKELNPVKYAQEYFQTRFGITPGQAQKLWSALSSELLHQTFVVGSIPLSGEEGIPKNQTQSTIHSQLKKLRQVRKDIDFAPKKNAKEYQHILMQVDLRDFYLSFRAIEFQVQSRSSARTDLETAKTELQDLLVRAETLNSRFKKLFEGKLYRDEIEKINSYRSSKAKALLAHLEKTREL